jgi:hypothetical protein
LTVIVGGQRGERLNDLIELNVNVDAAFTRSR